MGLFFFPSGNTGRKVGFLSGKAAAIKRRKILWRSLQEQNLGGCAASTYRSDGVKAGPQHQPGFAADTAASIGMSKQATNLYRWVSELTRRPLERTILPTPAVLSGVRFGQGFAPA